MVARQVGEIPNTDESTICNEQNDEKRKLHQMQDNTKNGTDRKDEIKRKQAKRHRGNSLDVLRKFR